ncbi:MAG: hypothetical protein LRY73_05500 [Bacillus sp. (in: Bacteria)]|nr:hypothetical protein [Bacillus sp. (in: firmicutes)]
MANKTKKHTFTALISLGSSGSFPEKWIIVRKWAKIVPKLMIILRKMARIMPKSAIITLLIVILIMKQENYLFFSLANEANHHKNRPSLEGLLHSNYSIHHLVLFYSNQFNYLSLTINQ